MKTYTKKTTGYKATDADMKCRDVQFALGEWSPEITGGLELCKKGYHFCKYPSGPWSYYTEAGTRVFRCEAEEVLVLPETPGADFKLVAKRVRLIEEILTTGFGNTGNRNTGDRNTGDRNTGDHNTGYGNTGDRNTGDRNTGDRNTGYGNTGYGNTGNHNTGFGNTGNHNTGYGNTGDRNTGDHNTGNHNTGEGNATNCSSGFFCQEEQKVMSFDLQTEYTRDEFLKAFPKIIELSHLLHFQEAIDFADFSHIPGITEEKLRTLHAKHLDAKNQH